MYAFYTELHEYSQVSNAKALQRTEPKKLSKKYKPEYYPRIDYALKIATALGKLVVTTAALIYVCRN